MLQLDILRIYLTICHPVELIPQPTLKDALYFSHPLCKIKLIAV